MSSVFPYGGSKVEVDVINDIFPSEEGSIDQIYGRIGNGKTYNATADIVDRLKKGSVEYANWPIDLSEFSFSQFDSKKFLFLGLLGIKRRFYDFLPSNLHYFEISDEWAQKEGFDDFESWLSSRTDCVLNVDEGHTLLDSYVGTKMSMAKRAAILHTRHFNRRLIIISQRPTAIHVSARANVNRFYKCEKMNFFGWFGILAFKKSEFQDMVAAGETVDDTVKPISSKWYFANKKILRAYDTQYLRRGLKPSQTMEFDVYRPSYGQLLGLAVRRVIPSFLRLKAQEGGILPSKSLGVKYDLRLLKNDESGSKRLVVADLGLNEQWRWHVQRIATEKRVSV